MRFLVVFSLICFVVFPILLINFAAVNRNTLLKSSSDRQILRLALPSIVSNITVPLLGLVDLAIVGHMGDASYIAAIAVGTMMFNVMYWILGFIRMSTSGMTSQSLGRRDFSGVLSFLFYSLSFAMFMAFLFIVFRRALLSGMAWLMSPPQGCEQLVKAYFNICIWGAPAMLGLYAMSGWFIGMQNTRFPMIVAIFQNVVNIVVSVFLVFVLGMKIEGVATGTLVAQWSGFTIAIILWAVYYGRLGKYAKLRSWLSSAAIDGIRKFMSVNRDIFLRTICIVGVNLFFTAAGSRQGEIILSANTILMTFFTLFSYVMDGFAFAGEALAGKYYGASNRQAFNEVCRRLFVWGGLTVVCFTLFYVFGGHWLLRTLTDESAVVSMATKFMPWAAAIPIAGMGAFIFDGIFVGITASRQMLLSSMVATASFFILYFSFFPSVGNHSLWIALLTYLMMRGVVQGLYFLKF